MFAVPGWSVAAGNLKAEAPSKKAEKTSSTKSRKRKRGTKESADQEVTTSNVAELWESVVEGKKPGPTTQREQNSQASKRQKKKKQQGSGEDDQFRGTEQSPEQPSKEESEKPAVTKKSKKEKKDKKDKAKSSQASQSDEDDASKVKSSAAVTKQPPLPPAPPKLTPLQASMREKLISARFRHLNETLYTKPSEEAFDLFNDSPEMFEEYHEGFRRQVKVWPENPVDSFLQDIRTRGKVRTPGRGQKGPPAKTLATTALPRTAGTAIIADLGCGDARLAESLRASGDESKMRLEVRSYDLQSPSPFVTKADIANLPLEDGSVNVAVFCLALMGTNWIDFVEEAYRILHWKGELWIAEIKSRLGPVRNKNAPVTHSVGNRKKSATAAKKGKGKGTEEENAENREDLAVEVDGADDRRRETDVSAFVEVLRKRGFVLQGEKNEAVDLSNKMFVKMHFIKGAAPSKGKGVKEVTEERKEGRKQKLRWPGPKDDEETPEVSEAFILKPCVYKIR